MPTQTLLTTVVREQGLFSHWRPGIGDPSVVGWVTVLLYFVAAINCWSVTNARSLIPTLRRRERLLWIVIALGFIALGVNKQLDLQTLLTEIGRYLAVKQGWADRRHEVQRLFIGGVVICGAMMALLLLWLTINTSVAARLALLGTVFVFGYVAVRAASFHHVDQFIGQTMLGFRWNWIFEISGITLVLAAATWRLWRRAPSTTRRKVI
jgi:hypothetical protein